MLVPVEIRPHKREFRIAVGFLVLSGILCLGRPDLADGKLIYCFAAFALFSLLAYGVTKLRIVADKDGLTQELLFKRRRFLAWADLRTVKTEWEVHGHGAQPKLVIGGTAGMIGIQYTQYSRKDLVLLLRTLKEEAPWTVFSAKANDMAEGRFPWYIK